MRNISSATVIVVLLLLPGVIVLSCVHEIPAPRENAAGTTTTPVIPMPGCSADSIYFEQQVLPVVNTLCGKSGCHGTTQRREFQLIYTSKAESYSAISSRFSSTSKLTKTLNEMAGQRISGYTPPSADQLATLQKWIAQGRKNNSCNGCDVTQFNYAGNVEAIFRYYCNGCHPGPGSQATPNLSSYDAIKAELTNNPGRLLGSIKWTAPYNTSTTKMPQGSNQLSSCELTVIQKWIEAGAPNN